MKFQHARVIALIGILALLVVAPAVAQTADSKSLDEVNKQLSNPAPSAVIDEPKILSSSIASNCPTCADGEHGIDGQFGFAETIVKADAEPVFVFEHLARYQGHGRLHVRLGG